MNAETLLRLTEFELRTAGDYVDYQDAADNITLRMRAIGLNPMNVDEADNARFDIRELRSRLAARARAEAEALSAVSRKGGAS